MDDFNRFQPPGQLIDVGGHRLYLLCMGERRSGRPTVILEAGHSDWSHCWQKIQPEIARFARVIVYDRAGFGWSDPGPFPRSPVRLVTELHDLLLRAGECGPYVFVGHSLGAALGRLFTGLYPGEVVGMVWVDSAHEQMQKNIPFWETAYQGMVISGHLGAFLARAGLVHRFGRKLMIAATPSAQTPEDRAVLVAQMSGPRFFETMRDETRGWFPAENWACERLTLDDLPVIMIEAQYPPETARGYPSRQWREFRAGWASIQEYLSRLSTRTRRIPVECGHNVMYARPDVIIQAVRDLFELLGQPEASEGSPYRHDEG